MSEAPAIVWLRQDLRLGDNPALRAAIETKRPLVLLYVLDDETVMAKKPTQPVEVRVTVTMESYYNYDFPNSSENEWQSYRLEFPGENQVLYGYLPRSSALNLSMVSALDRSPMLMTLKIRYRDASSHASQVLIDSIVAEGWVKDLPKS